jgi:phosphatidylglycerol:prolipoprotein diacylglycerol transferase
VVGEPDRTGGTVEHMPLEFPAWDPVLLDLPGPLALRWYGLMYMVGFFAGYWILVRLIRMRFLRMAEQQVADLIFWLVLGVMVGGRLGYVVFYEFGAGRWGLLEEPWRLFALWEGGLAFHGGLLGVAAMVTWFARRAGVPVLRLGDAVAIATCPGIFAVRMANFINGELYGRVTSADTFGAMQFPTDPIALQKMGVFGESMHVKDRAIQVAVGHQEWSDVKDQLPEVSRAQIPFEELHQRWDWEAIRESVPYRHPSQIYEGLSEGLLLGLVLWALLWTTRRRLLAPGGYFGVFLLGYGIARSLIENLRQPDAQFRDEGDSLGTVVFGLTMGQILSAAMLIVGAVLLGRALFSGRTAPVDTGDEDDRPTFAPGEDVPPPGGPGTAGRGGKRDDEDDDNDDDDGGDDDGE